MNRRKPHSDTQIAFLPLPRTKTSSARRLPPAPRRQRRPRQKCLPTPTPHERWAVEGHGLNALPANDLSSTILLILLPRGLYRKPSSGLRCWTQGGQPLPQRQHWHDAGFRLASWLTTRTRGESVRRCGGACDSTTAAGSAKLGWPQRRCDHDPATLLSCVLPRPPLRLYCKPQPAAALAALADGWASSPLQTRCGGGWEADTQMGTRSAYLTTRVLPPPT